MWHFTSFFLVESNLLVKRAFVSEYGEAFELILPEEFFFEYWFEIIYFQTSHQFQLKQ
jgi:hypothetical protein